MDPQAFYQVLHALLSTENDVRSQAEESYNNLAVEAKVSHLLAAIQNAQMPEESRLMAAVLLRRLFTAEFGEFYAKLPPEAQGQLKQHMLLTLQQDESPNMRRKICEVVAEMARNLIDDDGNNLWPEFMQFLFQCASAPSVQMQESALRIFASVPSIFGNHQNQHLDIIKAMLAKYMDAGADAEVRFQAVRALGAFILFNEKEEELQKRFSELLPPAIMIIAESIQREEDQTLLKMLIELAEAVPRFLRPAIEPVFEMCMKAFSSEDIGDSSWKHLALEVMVSLAENAPAMVRKRADKYVTALIPLVLQMMTDLDDDPEWAVSDEISEEDTSDNNVIAESALDRLACGLGGKAVLPQIVAHIPTMLASADWKQRHAALMAISAAGEGCHKQMEAMLDNIVGAVLKYLMDPHPRVRYAALNAIGQMSTDFSPVFEKKFHDKVIPGLLSLLDDVGNPRVQAHAGAALVNFAEDCPKNILTGYLNDIMGKLEEVAVTKFNELVEKGTKLVLEQIVTTIASVADTVEKEFVVYYDRLMPCLKYIIQNANTDELKLLRGKTIECISLIGLAVGAEKFMTDASEVMDLLLKTHVEGDLADDDPQTSYLISAWARICKILGKQFEQYLPLVMGPVMAAASMKPEVTVLDNDEIQDVEGDNDWQFVNLGDQQNFGIRTAGLEDKASACEMLVCYAKELKEGFSEYAEEVVRLMVPMLKFYFHDGVRTAAAESLPYLLQCARIKGAQYVEGMWAYICPELLKAIEAEPEVDVVGELLHSLGQCIETLGPNCLTEEARTETLRLIDKLLVEHFEKSDKRAQARKEEDYDDGVEEQLAEADETDNYILSRISDVIHALFLTEKGAFLPYFNQLAPHFAKLLDPQRSCGDHQWGICVFDDLIEFTGPLCAQYQQIFLQPLAVYAKDKKPDVRQAAVYGCGVLGHFGGDQFAAPCAQLVQVLAEVIMSPEGRTPEYTNPTENAISAVAKILKHNSSAIQNKEELIAMWFSWLPVVEDAEESPHVYGYLCDLIQANHPTIIGANNVNLPRIVSIFGEVFHREAIALNHPEAARMLSIIKQIEANPDVFQACIAHLTPQQNQALQDAFKRIVAPQQ